MDAELVVDARNAVGESPVWSSRDEALYWVDIGGKRIWRWHAPTARTHQWSTGEMPACMAPVSGTQWLCAMESGVFRLTLDPGSAQAVAERIAAITHRASGMRFNDGRCDRQGRLRAGTMLMDMGAAQPFGVFYALESRGLVPLVDGLIVPNGLAFSPDGRTMYLSDSHPHVQCIWAFDYDIETGRPSHRRVFVDMKPLPGRPDGAAVDADGCYWICGNDAGLVHRFTPQGRLDRSLEVPVKKPAMCAFGGVNLDTLYVTSIRPEGIGLADQPLAGGVFALRPGVRGLPELAAIALA